MATLYITEQHATLRREQNRLVVERDGNALKEIHDFKVERVVVFGNAQLSTQAMAFLPERGIDTTFLSTHGRLKGRLAPIESKNVPLRIAQYERSRDLPFALNVARDGRGQDQQLRRSPHPPQPESCREPSAKRN
jgi:CRISPR-associated protein Cas1